MATYINPGLDASGNGNNWTTNNINWTAPGTTYDVMTDVPTNTNSNTANYATLNPINVDPANPSGTITNGNLSASNTTSQALPYSTIGFTTGKYYFEFILTALPSTATAFIGVCTSPYAASNLRAYRYDTGQYFNGTTWVSYGATWTTNDVIGTAIDMTNQTIEFYKNGTSQGQITSLNLTGLNIFPMFYMNANNAAGSINFGQRPFSYTPPSGFYPLNTYNLPTPTILAGNQYFGINLWTGNGSTGSRAITGLGFKPDWVWWKNRTTAKWHQVFDSNRGADKALSTNATDAEDASGGYGGEGSVTSFDTDGYTLQGGVGNNENGSAIVGWAWQAGQGTNVSNTQGTITSTVSANTTAGFSIVTYTGTGANATVGHGLGVAPKWVIVKGRNVGSTNWFIYTETQGATKYLDFSTGTGGTDTSAWNSSAPTSTVFSVGTSYYTNYSATTYVAYCFAQVAGYSAFGSYTGNGSSDGTFVYTGFRPRYFMVKRTDASSYDWILMDTARDPINVATQELYADLSIAEGTAANNYDILSNGFKARRSNAAVNASGGTYIYMAFAENPFKIARAR